MVRSIGKDKIIFRFEAKNDLVLSSATILIEHCLKKAKLVLTQLLTFPNECFKGKNY